VNLVGTASRAGSTFATVMGWLVLVGGGTTALGVALLMVALGWPMGAVAFGLPIALFSLVLGVVLLRGGTSLERSAVRRENATARQALLALASHKGAITARDAAAALDVPVAQADAMLTQLAKSDPERVAVDVDDQGVVWYRVAATAGQPAAGAPRVRVEETPGIRVADEDALAAAIDQADAEARKRAQKDGR
jgi:hypothetical protein